MNRIFLIEDHHEALKIWREKEVKNLDLVHIDAHIDFGFHPARPIKKIVNEARNLKELKRGLEYSLAFMDYEKDFDKQTDIGNYIYPAMQEGIVKNFYWVVPGGLKEFKESGKFIKNTVSNLTKNTFRLRSRGIISTEFLGRNFVVCTLERLPVLRQDVLLDIDTDFLIIDSVLNSSNTAKIGKRKPWILPQNLVGILKKRIKRPRLITIAYSVNGGWTPIKYKHLGDEIAYYFAPRKFKKHLKNNSQAAEYFNLFTSTGKKEYYWKAVKLNPTYRVADNNYGPLYLFLRKFSFAQDKFLTVLKVDPKNSACLLGLGNIALERRDFKKAKKCFSSALNSGNHRLFNKVKNQSLLGLAGAEFDLKNFKRAKELLFRYQTRQPLQPQSYYLLGRIFEKEKDFECAARLYQDAIRLGFGSIEPISRLLKVSSYLKEKNAINKYIIVRYNQFKKGFIRTKRLSLKKAKKVKGLRKIEEKMVAFEKRLEKIKKEGRHKNNERDNSIAQKSGYGSKGD